MKKKKYLFLNKTTKDRDAYGVPFKIEVNVYYCIEEENDNERIVIDEEEMQDEFESKLADLHDLTNKLNGFKPK